jgi:hypothetical protein
MECWFTVSECEWLKGIVWTAKRVNTAWRSKENLPAAMCIVWSLAAVHSRTAG